MAYVATMFAGLGNEKHFVTKSEPGPKETATEWVTLMTRVLGAKGYDSDLYCFKIEEV